MTYATAQFFAGTKDRKPAFLDYATGESNLVPSKKQKIRLNDIRTLTPQPTLQSHGFQRADFPSSTDETAFLSTAQAHPLSDEISIYYHDCETLVRSLTGASTVHAFHHRYRQQTATPTAEAEKIKSYTTAPVPDIHIDNDASTAHAHLLRILPPAEVARWTTPTRHWAIINVWRPLAPVRQMPLALLDPSSTPIHQTGLAEMVSTRGNYKSHIRGLRWHPEYRFYYASEMGVEDALVFVDFDSARRWRLGGVGHGAVNVEAGMEMGGEGVPLRKSVEVRCLVLYD